MRWLKYLLVLGFAVAFSARAESAKIVKVLPQFLDAQGQHALGPSLYARDAYQAQLRKTPKLRAGLRFEIQWKASGYHDLKLRLEARGNHASQPRQIMLEQPAKKGGLFGNWTTIKLEGDAYKDFGELTSWRATLWSGDQQVGEQKSFLW